MFLTLRVKKRNEIDKANSINFQILSDFWRFWSAISQNHSAILCCFGLKQRSVITIRLRIHAETRHCLTAFTSESNEVVQVERADNAFNLLPTARNYLNSTKRWKGGKEPEEFNFYWKFVEGLVGFKNSAKWNNYKTCLHGKFLEFVGFFLEHISKNFRNVFKDVFG